MEEWARSQTSASLVDFSSRQGEIEALLKDIAGRAASKEGFSYSRFFAVGLFRLLELASATDPTVLDKVDSIRLRSHIAIMFTGNVQVCSL